MRRLTLGTPEQLQDALDDCDLDHWVVQDAGAAQPLRRRPPCRRAAAQAQRRARAVPRRTLNDEAELKAWLAEVEQLVSTRS